MIAHMDEPLAPKAAKRLIREILKSGRFAYSKHAKDEMLDDDLTLGRKPRSQPQSMLIFRCTAKLLSRLKVSPGPSPATSTARLGGRYATILPLRPAHLILLVNEPTRLAAVLPARELATLPSRIPEAIAAVLRELGAHDDTLDLELHAMADGLEPHAGRATQIRAPRRCRPASAGNRA